MSLLGLLAQTSRLQLTIAILASVLSGIAELSVTICILESFRSGAILWWQFALVALFSLALQRYSRVSLSKLASKSIARMRRRLVRSTLHLPLRDLERIGPARLLVAFSTDLMSVATAVRNLASLAASLAILIGCLAYIGWLSRSVMAATACLCLICIGGAIALRNLETKHRHATRQAWDRVVAVYSMLLDGVKQLKINRSLARKALLTFENRLREQQMAASVRGRYSNLVATWTQGMFYLILGVAVFAPLGSEQLKFEFGLLALLQIRRPLRSLVEDSSAFADASVAFQRIADLGLRVTQLERAAAKAGPSRVEIAGFRRITLKGVEFRYDVAAAGEFVLGPLDMTLRPGELIFIAGGNGGGKTTLAKVLTGLYPPTAGIIRCDGAIVQERNINNYRSRFAVVFSDFCLFEGMDDLQPQELPLRDEQLCAQLRLERWMLNGSGSSDRRASLSSGQRRRIALLRAVIEDRPILVFDEWAADQDPAFVKFFYEEFLPSMRNSGKLVVVISRDESYFHLADRVLWIERGEQPTWKEPSSFQEGLPETRRADADA